MSAEEIDRPVDSKPVPPQEPGAPQEAENVSLQMVLDNLRYYAGLFERDGTIREMNITPLNVAGVSRADVIGKRFWEGPWFRDLPETQQALRAAFHQVAEGKAVQLDLPVRRADGVVITVDSTFAPLFDEAGDVRLIVGSGFDVTERRQTEEALRQSEERFRLFFEHSPLPTYLWKKSNGDFELIDFNTAAQTAATEAAQTLQGRWLSEFFGSSGKAVKAFTECLRSGQPVRREAWHQFSPEREAAYVTAYLVPVPPDLVVVHIIDMTHRKRYEEKLELIRHNLHEAQRIAHLGNWIWNIDHNGMEWSDEMYRILGYEPQQAEPSYSLLLDRVHSEDRSVFDAAIAAAVHQRSELQKEVRIVRPGGEIRFVRIHAETTRDPMTGSEQLAGTLHDITEEKRLQEEKRQHEKHLADVASMAMLAELAGGMAHELNQPLAAITNYADASRLLLDTLSHSQSHDTIPVEKLNDLLQKISAQAVRAGQVIHGLRKLVSRRASSRHPCRPNELVETVLHLLEQDFQQHEISVRRDLSTDLPLVEADCTQIEQVLINLIRNAVEAMIHDPTSPRFLQVGTSCGKNGWVMFDICDTGPGIPADQLETVFNPFFTTKTDGLGLGLAISRTIAEAHHGKLVVTPNSERGVTFRLLLPALNQPVPKPHLQQQVEPQGQKQPRSVRHEKETGA